MSFLRGVILSHFGWWCAALWRIVAFKSGPYSCSPQVGLVVGCLGYGTLGLSARGEVFGRLRNKADACRGVEKLCMVGSGEAAGGV